MKKQEYSSEVIVKHKWQKRDGFVVTARTGDNVEFPIAIDAYYGCINLSEADATWLAKALQDAVEAIK